MSTLSVEIVSERHLSAPQSSAKSASSSKTVQSLELLVAHLIHFHPVMKPRSLVTSYWSMLHRRMIPACLTAVVAVGSLFQASDLQAGAFTAGNIAVFQADTATLTSNVTASIVELSPTTSAQTPTNTIAIDGTNATTALRFSASASSTGYLSTTSDGSLLVFTGANTNTTAANTNTILPRGVGTLSVAGTFNLATTYTGASGSQPRSATSLNNNTWFIGDQGGFYTNSATTASPAGNIRSVKPFGGTVYAFTASTLAPPVGTISAATGGTYIALPGLANGTGSRQDFYLISSGSNGTTFDVLYVLDATTATAGTIFKYSLVSGSWTANGSYTTTFGGFGLAAAKSGSNVVLYASTGLGSTSANSVIKLTDTAGYNATINITTANNVTLYTAATGKTIKGVAFAPIAPPTPLITGTATAAPFTTTYGTASAAQTFPVSGSNLTAYITATAPTGFEVASDGATYGTTATFTQTGGNASGTLSVRLAATAAVTGTYDGVNITLTSAGATTKNITTAASGNNGNSITAKALTVTGAAVTTKPFDGNTNAFITGTLSGVVSPDVVTFNGTGTFASASVGNGIAVTSTSTLGGANAGNYTLTQPTGLTGNITAPAAVDLSRYVRVGRYDLPEPTRTTPPTGSLLCQEASNVTYNWDTDTLFLTGDGGTSVVQVSKTGQLINSMTLALNAARRAGVEFDDTEGLTYIGNGEFVMTEERDRTLVKFTYVPNTTLQRSATKTVKLGTTIGNIGLEGVCYDPSTSGFIVVKEKQPKGIFQTTIDWNALTASNGSPTAVNSTDLFNPDLLNTLDLSDVFALSNLPALNGTSDASHLLVISQESGQIVNCDRSGNVYSRLTIVADPGSPLTVPAMTMEGVCMDRNGYLYVTNEDGGGDFNHPQLWVYAPSTATNLAPTAVTLASVVSSLPELPTVANDIRVADILVTDDGIGANNLTLSGADAASFKIVGTALFLKAGTTLNATTKASYSVNVLVDDTTVGATPDASTTYNLTVVTGAGATPNLVITEVAPWSSGNSGPTVAADWFEVTNYGTSTVDLTGWTVDDNSNSYAVSLPIFGATSIAPGESVIFMETGIDSQAELDIKAAAFKTLWFGSNPPANLHFCGYSGSGVGLSTGGDAVNLFDIGGNLKAHVDFGANTGTASKFYSFDNATGLNNATISNLSVVGVSGAFVAVSDTNEIGSPGTVGAGATPLVSIVATDATASETGPDSGTFRISRTGSTASTLTAIYGIATGAGQATAADYTPALTGSVTFAVGQAYVDLTITPVDDTIGEGSETLTLSITDTGSYDVGASGTATITIQDNDALNMAPTAVALTNTVATISEAANTAANIRVADITVTDDGQGTNTLGVSGTDASFFTVIGNSLYLKSGTTLSNANKPSYSVTVTVDDTTIGATPDASTNFTLAVAAAVAPGSIVITEVAPWSSTAANSNGIGADWFEVTNVGTTTANITNWKVDDNSHAYASAVPIFGVTSIAPGESIILMEIATTNPVDLATKAALFRSTWFGGNPPANLQIAGYSGSGVGLSGTADEVVLFDASGAIVTGVGFGLSPTTAPFATFDNKAGAGGTTLPLPSIATASVVGTNGAFAALSDANEIGSPGFTKPAVLTIAAGDVTSTSAVLWAHSLSLGSVVLDYSTSSTFASGVTSTTLTVTDTTLPVKTAITGLTAGTQYYYRAKNLNNTVVGTFKTAPAAGSLVGLHFGISGDWRGELAPYPSVKNAAGKSLDFFLELGDTIYGDVPTLDLPTAQARSLSDYRTRFNEVYSTHYGLNTLADLRASTAIFAVIDDHEVTNDFSGGALRTTDSRFSSDTGTYINETQTFLNGTQAFREYHPIADINYGATGDPITANKLNLYRYSVQGKTAATFVLDTRSFRSAPLTAVTNPNDSAQVGAFVVGAFTPGRTLLGAAQKAQFKTDLLAAQSAGIIWKFVCVPEPIQNFGPLGGEDRFEGYAAERTELLKFIDDNKITNVVFVTADFHGTTVNKLSYQVGPGQAQIQTNSIEIITGAVAYDKPFGPTIVDLAMAAGLAPAGTDLYYQAQSAAGKEAVVLSIINPGLQALGYNQLSMTSNPLPNAHLINGYYTATNSYGWTEFTIDGTTQELNVKTWGIAPYDQTTLFVDPTGVTGRTPAVVSEFALSLKPAFNTAATAGLASQSHGSTIDLAAATGAYPAGGTFSGPGVTGGIFDPSTTSPGAKTITYSYNDSFGTAQSSTFTINVTPLTFTGVASGDADSSSAVLWTRLDQASAVSLSAQVSTDVAFTAPVSFNVTVDTSKDNTAKVPATGLTAGTKYYYRFVVAGTGETSLVGTFKTTPAANVAAPLHFAFSGDNDGLIRPYALASVIPAQNLDFYVNLGDVIYENASNLTTSGAHNGASWLNSPSVTLSNDSLSFNGVPRAFIPAGTPFATQAQLKADYEKKYRENFFPVNTGGQNSLQGLYAAQGNYTTWDNHELGNRKYIDGGAPAGGSVGGAAGTDMATGRGVDARDNGSGNVSNVNDVNTSSTDIMNRAPGWQTLRDTFLSYMPMADRGTISAPTDPRTDGTKKLYSAVPWGKNATYINTDARSYRDIRLKTANAGADDTGSRADNPNRTYLGATQFAWLKQTLLDAQKNGTTWKFVSISDPIDQIGPIGGALTLSNLPSFGSGSTYGPVNSDGGKSFVGGYRAERNALLKFIADNKITNVVFMATDDHQNRINEVTYSPTSQLSTQSSYVKVPYCFSIVCGPLGATGPDLITNHTFAMAKQYSDSIVAAQTAAGVETLGLIGYPGLKNLVRDGDPTAGTSPQAVDFYSPDTFNFTTLDVSADGKTLTVKSIGMDATAQNAGIEYANGPQARTIFSFQIDAPITYLGIASGDADSSSSTLWTRVNETFPVTLTAQVATDSNFTAPATFAATVDSTKDNTAKVRVTGLTAGTKYYYRFVDNASGATSLVGTFKTTPAANTAAPLHFAFSGDNDGLIRPYALASVIPAQNLDFYVNLGDVIYENASNLTTSGAHNGASWLNSPSVTLSNDSLSFNGVPRAFIPAGTPFATQAQLKADYEKKYRENFFPVNTGGQNSLQGLYAAQGNYTTWDNHELGNRKYIDGGAPAGGSVGGAAGTDMATGRGVDARDNGSGNVSNVNDVNTSSTDIMNRAPGWQTLRDTFLSYQPIADRGTISAPSDPRTDGSKQLYSAVPWGKNALYVNTDARSYRDIRLKTANAGADDTGSRADNPNRTYLGATQFAWLKQTLLDAQNNGTTWKFVSISDPIDQIGPIGGSLSLSNLPSFGSGSTYGPVNSDGGKSFVGGYRAERNALLKFIADNKITNVVFMATDDHQNRINEVTYSPTSQLSTQSSYVKVPYCFSIVCGPLGATGPDLITNHTFAMAKQYSDSIVAAQTAAGVETLGLIGYPGLKNLVRDGDPTAGTSPQAVDFYSPDTFNFTTLDVSADGKTLTVKSIGMDATAQNAGIEYANGPQARTIFSFQIDAPTPIQAWRTYYLGSAANSGNSADTFDSDGDGIPNLLEYALGSNPTVATGVDGVAALPHASVSESETTLSDRLSLVFNLDIPVPGDITYTVQATDDLTTWTDVATKVGTGSWVWLGNSNDPHVVITNQSTYQSVKIGDIMPHDASHPRRMMRLKVTAP